jgi:hypothetical protein
MKQLLKAVLFRPYGTLCYCGGYFLPIFRPDGTFEWVVKAWGNIFGIVALRRGLRYTTEGRAIEQPIFIWQILRRAQDDIS